jgi:hypothetical protein
MKRLLKANGMPSRASRMLARAVGNKRGAQVEAARRIGCGAGMVTRWMNGVTIPSLQWAMAIARAYPAIRPEFWGQAVSARKAA